MREQKNIFVIFIRATTQKDNIDNTTKVLKNILTSNGIHYRLEKNEDLNSF
jgi:tripartite-type tricarboxylate transporter receptor subunit TctC